MFQDNQFNWGRVVALFYFAYKLIVKVNITLNRFYIHVLIISSNKVITLNIKQALSQSMDSIPWIKEILSWAIDYLMTNVAWWIIQRGGWVCFKVLL